MAASSSSDSPIRTRRMGYARHAFTLIELLVAISIIGILAGLVLGGMYRANVAAKRINSTTTVNKVAVQIAEIWESYRNRKLPIDPRQILMSNGAAPYTIQYNAATGSNGWAPGWLTYFYNIRQQNQWSPNGVPANDPLMATPTSVNLNGTSLYANNVQVAALRLAATRELMRLEMPCQFADFTSDYTQLSNAPAVQTLLIPQPVNANPGGLSEQYRQFYRAHATEANLTYQSAECLYMIIKFASQNELGQKNITDDPRLVGDSDGDGMPEIQDAFLNGTSTPAPSGSPYQQRNMPIAFIRWPAGFISDLQPGPTGKQLQATYPAYEYASSRHDIFDPLRVDPRAFALTPLVFSAGAAGSAVSPFSDYDIWEGHSYVNLTTEMQKLFARNDPYFTDAQDPLPGTQMDSAIGPNGTPWPGGAIGSGAYLDNITNHLLTTRGR